MFCRHFSLERKTRFNKHSKSGHYFFSTFIDYPTFGVSTILKYIKFLLVISNVITNF